MVLCFLVFKDFRDIKVLRVTKVVRVVKVLKVVLFFEVQNYKDYLNRQNKMLHPGGCLGGWGKFF